MELRLFHRQQCPFSKKVRDFISQRGLEPRVDEIDIEEDDEARSELIDLCGGSQVPCLVVDGKPMRESEAIVAWLDENLVKRTETRSRAAG